MSSIGYISEKIQKTLDCTHCEVSDTSEDGSKFSAIIVSEAFAGKSLLQRHRLIYEIFTEELKGPIHALSLTTLTPAQFNPIPN